MKKAIYKITINNWESHNSKSKPTMPSVMISKRFFDDVKIQTLPAGGKLLYLGLLLRRGDVKETFFEASHEDLVRFAGGSGQVVERLMILLESLQLLSYEKIAPNRIEKNRIEENRIEKIEEIEEKKETVLPVLEKVDVCPKEQQPPEKKYEDIFTNKVKFRDWEVFLREKNIFSTSLGKGMGKVVERFETVDSLRDFIESVLSSPKTQSMNKIQLRRYVQGALINEAGIR